MSYLTSSRVRLIPSMSTVPMIANGSDSDGFVTSVIAGVEAAAKKWCRRDFDLHTGYEEFQDGDGSRLLVAGIFPIISITSITIWGQDNQSWPVTLADLAIDNDSGMIEFHGRTLTTQFDRFPRGKANVDMVYTAGYAVPPDDVLAGLAAWVAEECQRQMRDTSLSSEAISKWKWVDKEDNQDDPADPPKTARRYLSSYRDLVGRYRFDRK